MALVLILGWWLVAGSRAQLLPRPSLSLHPSQGVSLGDNVTLRCHLPRSAARVELYKEGYWGFEKQARMDMVQNTAEFHLVSVERKDAVKYHCRYHVLEPPGRSEKSNTVELVVTDPKFPPPSISMSSGSKVGTGTNVTIWCRNQENRGTIFLRKDGHSAPIQLQGPSGGGTATFTLFGVTQADSGTYRCSYRIGGFYLLSSPLGDNITLEVTPAPAPPGDERRSHGNLVVAVVRGCAAVLVFGLGLYFVLNARRLWIQRDDSPGGEDS